MFNRTIRERGMWRAWTKTGQSLELSWGRPCPVGLAFGQHRCSKHIRIGLGLVQVFIPRGIDPNGDNYGFGDEPKYGAEISREFGAIVNWGTRRWQRDLPFRIVTLVWEYEGEDGQWHSKRGTPAKTEQHTYTYVLRSGEKQIRCATIHRERWVLGRKVLHKLGWPKQKRMYIEVSFSGEVGERSGSWKGGCIGCGYRMLDGETPLDALRRMERERDFV